MKKSIYAIHVKKDTFYIKKLINAFNMVINLIANMRIKEIGQLQFYLAKNVVVIGLIFIIRMMMKIFFYIQAIL